MINPALTSLYILIVLFVIFYLNKDKLKEIFIKLNKYGGGKYVKICPKCGSLKIRTDFSNPVVWAYGTAVKYRCDSCGYLALIFPEVLKNEINHYKKGLKKRLEESGIKGKKEELADASTGFFVGVWEVIIFIILALIFLILLTISVYFKPSLLG
ncbi:hypothetical protein HYY70_04920 [Candidatus Woesearchaeota archaeon]|nr:hypothetical protein [Candidatus Woesearchaeota archaeon]